MNKKETPQAITLLEKNLSNGNLQEEELIHFQTELAELLRRQILAYTRGESNSIKTEVAQNLLQSILYVVDLSLSSEDNDLKLLVSSSLPDLYGKGMAIYQERKAAAKNLLQQVKETKLEIPIKAYTLTIETGFENFFLHMEIPLFAQEADVDIDYPLLQNVPEENGLLYVENYLHRLLLENRFCSCFPQSAVDKLTLGWAKTYHLSAADLMTNLTEMILRNAVFCVLVGRSPFELYLTASECDSLEKKLQSIPEEELPALLEKALAFLLKTIDQEMISTGHGNLIKEIPDLVPYLNGFIDTFLPGLKSSLKNHSLKGQLWVSEPLSSTGETVFIDGHSLSDEELRLLLSDLQDCENSERKTELFISKTNNIEDAMVLLDTGVFTPADLEYLFSRLSSAELGLLSVSLLDPAPMAEERDFSLSHLELPDERMYWVSILFDFLTESETPFRDEVLRHAVSFIHSNVFLDSSDPSFYNEL